METILTMCSRSPARKLHRYGKCECLVSHIAAQMGGTQSSTHLFDNAEHPIEDTRFFPERSVLERSLRQDGRGGGVEAG